jgi:glycosyltransferase involved in cell wall biosynthesis
MRNEEGMPAARDARLQAEASSRVAPIALLGRQDQPTDGVRDYCAQLQEAFARRGERLAGAEMRWDTQGWLRAAGKIWKESRAWRGRWVLLQYTALMWSRRGFPAGALAVLWILRLRGARLCVVFHDVRNDLTHGWKQRLRVPCQYWTMRKAFRWAACAVLTVPAKQVPWLPRNSERAVFVPVGANLPEENHESRAGNTGDAAPRTTATVAVFGVTGGTANSEEAEEISYVTKRVRAKLAGVRLMVLGRGSSEAEAALRKHLDGSGVELSVLGLLPAGEVRRKLAAASALLCVRGHISSRRGSAIAGIACGLPIVGYRGPETAFPITEAGVLLVDRGDRDALAEALGRVLADQTLHDELRQRSLAAEQKYFSWDAIAEQFARALAEH